MKDWKKLVQSGRVAELEAPSATEITQMMRHARLAFEDSLIPGLRPSRRFQILYEAAYRWCALVLRVEGWRTKGEGHHETLFSAMPHFLGTDVNKTARYLDRCRRRRNVVTYGVSSPPVTEFEVEKLESTVKKLDLLIMSWLKTKHPEYAFPEEPRAKE